VAPIRLSRKGQAKKIEAFDFVFSCWSRVLSVCGAAVGKGKSFRMNTCKINRGVGVKC